MSDGRNIASSWAARHAELVLLVPVAVGLFAYAALRAYFVSFTHDESISYLNAVTSGFLNVVLLSFKDANNHPLNTWGMYICMRLFGSSEFSLRLPNLSAYALYLTSSILLARRVTVTRWLTVVIFLVLNVNPMISEYFGLARGYGIGLGFLMAAIWLASESFLAADPRWSITYGCLAIASATLTTFANYSYIFFYAAFLTCYFLGKVIELPWSKSRLFVWDPQNQNLLALLIFAGWNSLLMFLFVGREIIELKQRDALDTGSRAGFWAGTLQSLGNESFVGLPWLQRIFPPGVVVIAVLAVLATVYLWITHTWTARLAAQAILTSIVFISATLNVLLPPLTGLNYLAGRNALFYTALIAMLSAFILNTLATSTMLRLRQLGLGLAVLAVAVLSVNWVLAANLTHTQEWAYDADTKTMLTDLGQAFKASGRVQAIWLGVDWQFSPAINYYRVTRSLDWLYPVSRAGLSDRDYDYYYYFSDRQSLVESQGGVVIERYSLSNGQLAQTPP